MMAADFDISTSVKFACEVGDWSHLEILCRLILDEGNSRDTLVGAEEFTDNQNQGRQQIEAIRGLAFALHQQGKISEMLKFLEDKNEVETDQKLQILIAMGWMKVGNSGEAERFLKEAELFCNDSKLDEPIDDISQSGFAHLQRYLPSISKSRLYAKTLLACGRRVEAIGVLKSAALKAAENVTKQVSCNDESIANDWEVGHFKDKQLLEAFETNSSTQCIAAMTDFASCFVGPDRDALEVFLEIRRALPRQLKWVFVAFACRYNWNLVDQLLRQEFSSIYTNNLDDVCNAVPPATRPYDTELVKGTKDISRNENIHTDCFPITWNFSSSLARRILLRPSFDFGVNTDIRDNIIPSAVPDSPSSQGPFTTPNNGKLKIKRLRLKEDSMPNSCINDNNERRRKEETPFAQFSGNTKVVNLIPLCFRNHPIVTFACAAHHFQLRNFSVSFLLAESILLNHQAAVQPSTIVLFVRSAVILGDFPAVQRAIGYISNFSSNHDEYFTAQTTDENGEIPNSSNCLLLWCLGCSCLMSRRLSLARRLFERANGVNPSFHLSMLYFAYTFSLCGYTDQAIRAFQETIAIQQNQILNGPSTQPLCTGGIDTAGCSVVSEAVSQCSVLPCTSVDLAEPLVGLGREFLALNWTARAREVLLSANDICEGNAAIWNELGVSYYLDKDFQDAAKCFKRAADIAKTESPSVASEVITQLHTTAQNYYPLISTSPVTLEDHNIFQVNYIAAQLSAVFKRMQTLSKSNEDLEEVDEIIENTEVCLKAIISERDIRKKGLKEETQKVKFDEYYYPSVRYCSGARVGDGADKMQWLLKLVSEVKRMRLDAT